MVETDVRIGTEIETELTSEMIGDTGLDPGTGQKSGVREVDHESMKAEEGTGMLTRVAMGRIGGIGGIVRELRVGTGIGPGEVSFAD